MMNTDRFTVEIKSEHIPTMIKTLESQKLPVVKRILKCLFWGIN